MFMYDHFKMSFAVDVPARSLMPFPWGEVLSGFATKTR